MKKFTLKRFITGAAAGALSVWVMDLLKDAGYLAGTGALLRAVLSACIVGALFSVIQALFRGTGETHGVPADPGANKDGK